MCKFTLHTSLSSTLNCPTAPLSPAKGCRVLAEDCSGHLVLIPNSDCPLAKHVPYFIGRAFPNIKTSRASSSSFTEDTTTAHFYSTMP